MLYDSQKSILLITLCLSEVKGRIAKQLYTFYQTQSCQSLQMIHGNYGQIMGAYFIVLEYIIRINVSWLLVILKQKLVYNSIMQIKGVLVPAQRNKELTQKQLKTIRLALQTLQLSPRQHIYYNLSSKQSKSGFFTNERLLILNTKDRELFYVSKIPEGLIPFYNYEEVKSLKFKTKISRENIVKAEITDFKCNNVPGKVSTLQVKFKKGGDQQLWHFVMGNSKLMYQWIDLVNKALTTDEPKIKTPQKNQPQQKIQPPQPVAQVEPPKPVATLNRPYNESKKILNDNINDPNTIVNDSKSKLIKPNTSSKDLTQQINSQVVEEPIKSQVSSGRWANNAGNLATSHLQVGQPDNLSDSRMANIPFSDHVSELKYLRKQNPSRFNISNQLSTKKLNKEEEQIQNYNRMNITEHSNSKNNFARKQLQVPNYDLNQRLNQRTNTDSQYAKADDYHHDSKDNQIDDRYSYKDNYNNNTNQPAYQRQISRKKIQNSEQIVQPNSRSRLGLSKAEQQYQRNEEEVRASRGYQRNASNYDPQRDQLRVIINSTANNKQINSGVEYRNRSQKSISQKKQSGYINHLPQSNQFSSKGNFDEFDNMEPGVHRSSTRNERIEPINSKQDLGIIRNDSSNLKLGRNGEPQRMSVNGSSYLNNKPFNYASGKGVGNLNSKRSFNRKKWNQIFAQTNNKLQVYQDFVHTSHNIVRQIINELPMSNNQKEYLPIEVKPPFFTYYDQGIIITLHYFQNARNIANSGYSSKTPLLFDQTSYEQLKRQFYNYNLVLTITSNEGFIKMPLCAYFEYKGVIALCKAEIPQTFSEVTPKRYEKQFDIIQNQIHVRFMYGSFNSYLHPNSKYIIVDNMRELIPEIPQIGNNKLPQFFRKQFLLNYGQIIQDMQTCNQANYNLVHQIMPDFLSKLQSLDTYIVNSGDLLKICHDSGISLAYLPSLIQQTKSPFIKKVLLTELVSIVFVSIFRSQINHLYATFPTQQFSDSTLQTINHIVIDSCHALIELMFGYSNDAENIWKIIVEQCSSKYKITVSKEDVVAGFLLGSIIDRIGLVCDFRRSQFNKHNVEFFVKSGNIPKDLLVGFRIKTRRYDLSSISPLVKDIQQILYSQPTAQNFKNIVDSLHLRSESIPAYLQPLEPAILTYMCNFVPYSEHEQFQHIGIYNMVILQPHSYYCTKLSLLAVKWCIKKKLIEQAFKIYQMKQIENAFWLGQYNPAISEYYDFFSMYYASTGKYEQAIHLAKLSLKNIIKVLGINQLPVADKHYQLGNIYFKMGRKQQSLKDYTRTKEILVAHNQIHIAEFAIILIKLAVLYLNFGKISDCVNNCLEALKIFDDNMGNEQDQIGTFQILARCYEITKKSQELINIGELVAQKFNFTQNPSIFERMSKIVIFIRLKTLSSAESKAFLTIITKLQQQNSVDDQVQVFSFLHKKSQSQILLKKVINFMDNIISLYEQANKKDLFRRYKSLDINTKNEAEQMLVILDALGMLIGYGYMIGSLKDSYE